MARFQTREEAEVFAQELIAQFPGIRFEASSLDPDVYPGTYAWVGLLGSNGNCVSTIDSREKFQELLIVAQKLTQAIADNQQSEEIDREEIPINEEYEFARQELGF